MLSAMPQLTGNNQEDMNILYDYVVSLRRELYDILTHIDDDNMGKITAKSIETSTLIVGENIRMGPNAKITWSQVSDGNSQLEAALENYITTGELSNTLIDYLTNGDFTTLIGQDYIVTGKILANQITAGTFTSFTIKTAPDGNARIVLASDGLKTYNAANQLHGTFIDTQGGTTAFRIFDTNIHKFSIFYGMVEGDAVNKLRITSTGCPMKISAGADNMSIKANTIYLEGNVNISGTVTGVNAIAKFA